MTTYNNLILKLVILSIFFFIHTYSSAPAKRKEGGSRKRANSKDFVPVHQPKEDFQPPIVFRDFCLGTDNGRNSINIGNQITHYERLKKSYVRCRRIIGNLEITHVDKANVSAVDRDEFTTDSKGQKHFKRPFHFLEHLEEITGYLLIFNVRVDSISLPRLKIIWGEKLHEGNALQVDSSSGLRTLNLPALRTIEEGNVTLKRSPDLCYMDPKQGFVNYSEFLGDKADQRLNVIGGFSPNTCSRTRCSRSCGKNCFGSHSDQCQTVYRCHNCESGACYADADGVSRCCDDACTGGCYGDGKERCYACKRFEQDGRCVNECNGIHAYKQNTLVKEDLPDDQKRYYYGRHCVKECPSGTLIEDKYCVTRCSAGHYRNALVDERNCVPCNGPCPKVCQLNEPINSVNIRQLVNCSEIEGNIEILNHVFEAHMPNLPLSHEINFENGTFPDFFGPTVPALTSADLEVLQTVRIVTGYVVVDGGRKNNPKKPNSLAFLRNLEVIEGRRLYFEKFALYVIGNYDLKWLGLRSLKRIHNGLMSVASNRELCYSYTIPFERVLGVADSVWRANKNTTECESSNRKCDSSCDQELGCWGPGPELCVRCRNFIRDEMCAETCPRQGYFISREDPRSCVRCHEQCLECYGTLPTQCTKCQNYELTVDAPIASFAKPVENLQKCVAKCPNETYAEGAKCQPCHPSCYEFGCSGPNDRIGASGCNRCRFGVHVDGDVATKCLMGETEDVVCGTANNLSANYFLTLGHSNSSKFMCQKCRSECSSCLRDSVLASECQCLNYRLIVNATLSPQADICANSCGKGSYLLRNRTDDEPGLCRKCHEFCDDRFSCDGPGSHQCDRCALAGVHYNDTSLECLAECPPELPYPSEGICYTEDKEVLIRRKRNIIVAAVIAAFLLFIVIIALLVYKCSEFRKKYVKEAQMHLPEIPPIDPLKITQRPNMRRLNLIGIDELDHSKTCVLGTGAFGIVYAGKWKPPGRSDISIPVAIKAINPSEARQTTDEKEMMREAGLMASVQHEHLLPLVGICVAKGGLKIVTILRPLGSLLAFLDQHKNRLGSKQLMLYCYQITSAMEFLVKKKIVHRDLAARNVLVKNINHVEVTDFGLAAMLQGHDTSVVVEGRVAVKWLAIESLRQQLYNEKTDVWSFGVTCWEIVTCGQSPYRELNLPKDHKLARELVAHLERGYRLKQPINCSQELYQELLNCWLVDSDSRPSFRVLKERFESFCRAPHIYIQDRQAAQQMNSISALEQRMMIERLLKDNDFLDPVNIDPSEYAPVSPRTVTTECFFSAGIPTSPTTPTRTEVGDQFRHGSTTTNASSRYKCDPLVGRRRHEVGGSLSDDAFDVLDDANYLMPKNHKKRSTIGESIDEADEDTFVAEPDYITVIESNTRAEETAAYVPTYLNDTPPPATPVREYANDEAAATALDCEAALEGERDLIQFSPAAAPPTKSGEMPTILNGGMMPYANVHQAETAI